ncbi:MAG: hypothetical protein O3A14_19925 [Cyanobacteria bacterium]|nr:hypothetical protein [Cyanobacteriota bacterium]
MKFSEVRAVLAQKLPPEYHGIRKLPGGGNWVYIPWRNLVRFLDDTCPDHWGGHWGSPMVVEPAGEYIKDQRLMVVPYTLCICGVSREALGSAPMQIISSTGNDASQGDPLERAQADAFRSACEMFEIGHYLHRQKDREYQQKLMNWVRAGKQVAGAQQSEKGVRAA